MATSSPITHHTELVTQVRGHLTDDLRRPPYQGHPNPITGHCYVASEVLFHALGGKKAGWRPMTVRHEGSVHWFLQHQDGHLIDPTADQFATPIPYHHAVGRGFLTREPSKRARILAVRSGITLDSGTSCPT